MNLFFYFISFCDAAESFQMVFQDPATEVLEWMIDFYDLIIIRYGFT
jgi:hypothetical protein